MERLLQELQSYKEYETDHVLSQLICAQRVNEAVAQIHQSDHLVDVRPSPDAWAANLETLLSALNTLRASNGQKKVYRCEFMSAATTHQVIINPRHRSGIEPLSFCLAANPRTSPFGI